jgi:hypothetical protein
MKIMDKTKTAVILLIVAIVGIGVLIYANREKLVSKTEEAIEE